jgi:hypothetical protein
MATILTEKTTTGELSFEFSDKWQVCKYDEQYFYKKIKHGLKAVDFMALFGGNGLLLMEIKYVISPDENSKLRFYRNSDDDKIKDIKSQLTLKQQKAVIIDSARPYLVDEVSKKVKDTVLGLLASYRQRDLTLFDYAQSLFVTNDKPILVLLFLERNPELNQEKNFKPLASDLKLAIEQKLNFLGNIQVGVVNSLTLPSTLDICVKTPSSQAT